MDRGLGPGPFSRPMGDRKAGHCGFCRRGSCGLCASDSCACGLVVHRGRPGFARAGTPSPTAQQRPKPPTVPVPGEPVQPVAAPAPMPMSCLDHALAIAEIEGEAVVVERLARAYASLAVARRQAADTDLIPVSPGQLRLVGGS